MSLKTGLGLLGKYILLTVLYFIINMVAAGALSFKMPPPPAGQMDAVMRGLVLVAAVNTLVFSILILRSRWHGWRLALALAFSWLGVTTVLTTMEAVYFGRALGITPDMTPGLVLPNLVTIAIFVPLAVLILGKRKGTDDEQVVEKVSMPAGQWALKLAAIAVIYLVLYFIFGVFVAWSNPELRAMYGNGADQAMFSFTRLLPLQIFRSWLWVLFSLPIIRMTKGSPWQVAIVLGLFLALPMNIGHAIPNAFFPDPSVRLSHFIETTTSNFILGLSITWLFYRQHSSIRDLFGREKVEEDVTVPALNA